MTGAAAFFAGAALLAAGAGAAATFFLCETGALAEVDFEAEVGLTFFGRVPPTHVSAWTRDRPQPAGVQAQGEINSGL